MWLSVVCGLALGLLLNLCADWLPRRAALRDALPELAAEVATASRHLPGEIATASRHSPGETQPRTPRRVVRWAALLLLATGLVLYLRSSATAGVVPALAYCSLLLLIAAIDLEHRLVPDVLILTGLILAVGFRLLSVLPIPLLRDGEFGPLFGEGTAGLTTALAGAAVGGGLFLLLALARRDALGAGDVKLAFLIGMLTGFPWVLQALVLGILLGGLAAALLLLFKLRGPKQYIPYAPYLVAGAMATLLCGQHIAQWYATLTGTGG